MKAIEVTLKLLEAVAESEDGVAVHDISRQIHFSKSTTHRALQHLEQRGFVVQDAVTARYRCGPALMNLSFSFLSKFKLRHLARPILQRIVGEINENIYLCAFVDHTLCFIDNIESTHPIRYNNPMGKRKYLHAGAAGKVILAFLPPEEIDRFITQGLPRMTERTIVDAQALLKDLKKIRKQGYAFSTGEYVTGGIAIAVPLLNAKGLPVGCLDIAMPEERYDPSKLDHILSLMRQGADDLQKTTGYYEDDLSRLI